MDCTLILLDNGKMVTPKEYRLTYRQRLIEEAKPKPPTIITVDEYKHIFERASFKCPKKHHPELCDGTACPTRKDDIYDDYFDECVKARSARLKIDKISEGKIVVMNNHQGWEIKPEF